MHLKRFFLFILLPLLLNYNFIVAQRIGVRGTFETSNNKLANGALGFGVYGNPFPAGYSDFEVLMYADYAVNKRRFIDCVSCQSLDIETQYKKYVAGMSGMINVEMNSRTMEFKIGPDVSYLIYSAKRQGLLLNWNDQYKSHFIGLGIMANFVVIEFMNTPLNLDFFITPVNYFKVQDFGIYRNNSIVQKNMFYLNTQIGLSYMF